MKTKDQYLKSAGEHNRQMLAERVARNAALVLAQAKGATLREMSEASGLAIESVRKAISAYNGRTA